VRPAGPPLELQVTEHGEQVRVAAALADAVRGPLDLPSPDLETEQRVRDRAAAVVMEVQPDVDTSAAGPIVRTISSTISATSHGIAPPLVSHSTTASAPASAAAMTTSRA
jgi:hypothetical protein